MDTGITLSYDLHMERTVTVIALASRVLMALNLKRSPDPRDVIDLRALNPLAAATTPLDEIACEVIQQALKSRREELNRHRDGNSFMIA